MSVLYQDKCVCLSSSWALAELSVAEQSREQIPVRSVFTNMETPVGRSLTSTEWKNSFKVIPI